MLKTKEQSSVIFQKYFPNDMFIDFRKKGRGKERERKKNTLMWERNMNQMLPGHAQTRDQTHNLLAYGTIL